MAERSEHDAAERARFFRALWPVGLPSGLVLNLWTPPGRSYWHDSLERAVADTRPLGAAEYYGVGLGSAGHIPAGTTAAQRKQASEMRFHQDQIYMIPGFFVDFDFKKDLTEFDAVAFMDATFKPSMIVHTGGGLHLYWLFNKPLIGDVLIRDTLAGFKNYVMTLPHGSTIDHSIIEPARVLRIPGSINYKYPDKPRVHITYLGDERYDPQDFPLIETPPVDRKVLSFYLEPKKHLLREGEGRNDQLMRWCNSFLKLLGATSFDHILDIATAHNRHAFDPPLDAKEVFTTARSAWNTWQRKDGGRNIYDTERN